MKLVLAIILGFAFGFVLYRAGAAIPSNIMSMLRLKDFTLMKIIVGGIGFASVLLALFGLLGWLNPAHLSVKTTHLGVLVGGLLVGVGFGTIGTCPGTCVAAAGTRGHYHALSTLLGGLLGAWVFSITYGFWWHSGLFSALNLGKLTLFHLSDRYPAVFPIGYSGLLVLGVLWIAGALLLPNRTGSE